MEKLQTKVVFASGHQGEFGLSGKLPWGKPIEKDMKHFKEYTEGTTLLMGRNTWEALPQRLRGLKHVVMSSALENFDKDIQARIGRPDKVIVKGGLEEAIEICKEEYKQDVCIIGGKDLVERGLHLADSYSCTIVHSEEGNVFPSDTQLSLSTVVNTIAQREVVGSLQEFKYDTCEIAQGELR